MTIAPVPLAAESTASTSSGLTVGMLITPAATDNIRTDEEAKQITLSYADWQRVLGLQMILARYIRLVSEPDVQE